MPTEEASVGMTVVFGSEGRSGRPRTAASYTVERTQWLRLRTAAPYNLARRTTELVAMAGLEFRFLGDLDVRRGGQSLPLPPSKKTRALLAYLCLQPRRLRRERLCELLWEIPDDPRGSLRWSLSKLRRLVDDRERSRIVADRTSVGIDVAGTSIDVREVHDLVAGGLEKVSTQDLEAAAARYRGNFLEGLDFSNFHDYHTWCVSEREQALRDRAALLTELVRRLSDDPGRTLPHARALVGLFPYDEGHRAVLIRLLNAARQVGDAEEQYQFGLRMLKEAGLASTGALLAARHMPRIDAPPRPSSAPRPVAEAATSPPLELVGREAEMTLIDDTIADAARNRQAAIVLITGVPGIGKTRVLEAALVRAQERNAFVLRAAAFESDTIRPFSVWIDGLRMLDPARHDAVFGDRDVSNRERLFSRLSDLVTAQASSRPVVLLLDDAQWCDESSAAAFLYVARMNKQRPLVGILAARGGEVRDNVPLQQVLRGLRRDGLLREIELGPLSKAALAELIDRQAPSADAQRLSIDCGGNPLLAIELARAERAGSAQGSLEELVRDRLLRYGTVGAEALRWAAVVSERIDVGTLVKVSGIDPGEVAAALENAERHAMLRATDRGLRFAHDLIARAVYTDISPVRRRLMHRRAAELLERDTAQDLARAADLAHHATLSGDPALAARAMVSAGRLSLRFFANADAQSLARRGLQLAESLPSAERVCVEIDLHDILLAAAPPDDWDDAAARYTTLAERALDHGALAHARLGYHMASYARWTLGHWGAAREQTLQAARVVRGGHDEAHIVGMAETAKCLVMIERDISHADALLTEAHALAERRGFNHHAIAAGFGMLRFHEGRLDEAAELFREARTLCKSAGDRLSEFQADEHLMMLDLQRGKLEDARARGGELLALGDKLREGSEEPFARAMVGLCDYAIDDRCEGLDAALADLRVKDAKHRLAYLQTRAALIDCERGRAQSAIQRATEALGYATLLERATEMLLANVVLSHDCVATGDRKSAVRFAKEVVRLGGTGVAAWTREIAARLAARNPCAARKEAR